MCVCASFPFGFEKGMYYFLIIAFLFTLEHDSNLKLKVRQSISLAIKKEETGWFTINEHIDVKKISLHGFSFYLCSFIFTLRMNRFQDLQGVKKSMRKPIIGKQLLLCPLSAFTRLFFSDTQVLTFDIMSSEYVRPNILLNLKLSF